jgi:Domain of unknown function (DUF4157)
MSHAGRAGGLRTDTGPTVPPVRLMRQHALGPAGPSSLPSIVREALPGPGRPLEPGVQAFFEPRFGHDFSAVRVHADEQAARAADAMDASAFTVGNSIWFGRGMYRPEVAFGLRLLAHELAHTIQQRGHPVGQRSLRVGGAGDAAETMADRVADAALAGEPMPHIGPSSLVIRRAPKVSPVPGNLSQRLVEMDDGTRYRVTRTLQEKTTKIPGEAQGPSLTPHIDDKNVWLQVDWCTPGTGADYRGQVRIGANVPEAAQAALQDVGQSILAGQDPVEALRKAPIKPFASVAITKSERLSLTVRTEATVQPGTGGKVTGGGLDVGVKTAKTGSTEFTIGVRVDQPPPASQSKIPNVTPNVGIRGTFGGPEKVTCERKRTTVTVSYQCEKIVPKHEEPRKVAVTDRQTRYFYFKYDKSAFAGDKPEAPGDKRTAGLDAEAKRDLKKKLDDGYRIETIRGYASPEGAEPYNQALSDRRVNAVEEWVNKGWPQSALGMRPSPFAEGYRRSPMGELYGSGGGPESPELVGKPLAEYSVHEFETMTAEEPRRTPDVMAELAKRKAPERQTGTVWPLLRRAEIVVSKPGTEIRMETVPESATVMDCPAEVSKAAAEAFDREAPVKK